MSSKNKSLAVAVISTVTDGIDAIKAELNKLQKINDSPFKTGSASLEGYGDLSKEISLEKLIMAFSSVAKRGDAYAEAGDALVQKGVINSYPVLKFNGFSSEDWQQTIALRIQIVQQKERYDELNEMKKAYEELMDKDDKMALLNKRLAKFVANNGPAELTEG